MSGSSRDRESPHVYVVILHARAVLKDFMPYPAPDSVAADFLRAGDAVAEGDVQRISFQGAELIADAPPVVAAQGDAAVLDDRTALGSRRCDRLSRGRSRRFALLSTAAQKQHRREDKGQSFYFHVRMFSFLGQNHTQVPLTASFSDFIQHMGYFLHIFPYNPSPEQFFHFLPWPVAEFLT